MSWRNSAAPWPVSTLNILFSIHNKAFHGQDFFSPVGVFLIASYPILDTEKYGPRALENWRQTKAIHRGALSWKRWPLLFVFGLETFKLMFHIRSLKFSALPQLPLLSLN